MKKIKVLIVITLLLIIIVSSFYISYEKFKVYNPISVSNGLIQVVLFYKDYVQIQDYPKVIIANSDFKLVEYMKESDYSKLVIDDSKYHLDGLLYSFYIAEHIEIIEEYDNKYYLVWKWNDV